MKIKLGWIKDRIMGESSTIYIYRIENNTLIEYEYDSTHLVIQKTDNKTKFQTFADYLLITGNFSPYVRIRPTYMRKVLDKNSKRVNLNDSREFRISIYEGTVISANTLWLMEPNPRKALEKILEVKENYVNSINSQLNRAVNKYNDTIDLLDKYDAMGEKTNNGYKKARIDV